MMPFPHRVGIYVRFVCLLTSLATGTTLRATDYFLTIGGGYNPTGNQASLEANVLFFQQILVDKHRGDRSHDVYFADGDDAGVDLQVQIPKKVRPNQPATDLIASLHRRRGEQQLEYRNHRVPQIAGPLDPSLIRVRLEKLSRTAQAGDRVIVYVTAHGSEGRREDPYNTTIDCWNEKRVTAREFTRWLDQLPPAVPVVMVMAQCYCGGFGHTIFTGFDPSKGLTDHPRVGFFAQQFNLPAAGCRPDIDNDEEFSSYFWGALAGRTRSGVPVTDCDTDHDGVVSFAEAFSFAVVDSPTIDIPLRTSDVLLRTYSRLASEARPATDQPADATVPQPNLEKLVKLSGPLQSFVDHGRPVSGRIVAGISQQLGFSLQDDASSVAKALNDHRRSQRRSNQGRRRNGSGRRELLSEIAAKWPELGDDKHWGESPLLRDDNQEQLLKELQELPSWKTFEQRRQQAEEAAAQPVRHELREIKFRRLVNTLESIALEQNLPLLATPKVREQYRQMIQLEESSLNK
ncbi:MAG: hypothetical protein JSS49_25070 [Planctomycetes bacterium]|nr:hypothetical protein [Planctomycetota bacterium]